jgi:hypothetical protein
MSSLPAIPNTKWAGATSAQVCPINNLKFQDFISKARRKKAEGA